MPNITATRGSVTCAINGPTGGAQLAEKRGLTIGCFGIVKDETTHPASWELIHSGTGYRIGERFPLQRNAKQCAMRLAQLGDWDTGDVAVMRERARNFDLEHGIGRISQIVHEWGGRF